MEVAVKMESVGMEQPEETVLIGKYWSVSCQQILIWLFFLTGRFSMVCRNASTHRAREVNPLIVSTDEEQELYALGERMSV